jgi:GT2 family glycosyltransferase
MPNVSVIIVNYNGSNVIHDCLVALNGQSYRDFEIIVVDNGSSDNSLDVIKRFERTHPLSNIKIVLLENNAGFAGANIKGFNYAGAEYIALLNNDAEPDTNWLHNLVRAIESNPAVGICASKLIVHGTKIIDSAGDGFATSLKGFKRGEGEGAEKYETEEYVFGACAGAALYRRKMIEEIGFLDEDFFLIQEDTDLNFRAQLAGWKVMFVPTAVVYHKVRSTIGHMSDEAVYYSLRNTEFVRIKNIPFSLLLRCFPAFIVGEIAEFFYFAVKHGKIKSYLRAKADVIRALQKTLNKRRQVLQNVKKVETSYLNSMMTSACSKDFFTMKIKKILYG